jgi:hypothetical protein
LGDAFGNVASVKSLNPNARCTIFGYDSMDVKTLKKRLPVERASHSPLLPDQILCLSRELLIVWNSGTSNFDGFKLEEGPIQQLINEVLSASKVKNLQPYLPGIGVSNRLFQV